MNPQFERTNRVAVLLAEPTRTQILGARLPDEVTENADVRIADGSPAAWDLRTLLRGVTVAITGWGTPPLSQELLADLPELRLIAHTAGSIRHLVPLEMVGPRLRVSHAAAIIADAVAEFTALAMLNELRRAREIDAEMKGGAPWPSPRGPQPPRLLGGRTVGLIGAGRVGMAVMRLLAPFGCRVLLYDPLVRAEQAESLGAEPRDLSDVLRLSDLISLHAPVLPETRGMIGATELSLMRDGALLVNTARAVLVDEPALRNELRSGRLRAALDVFWQEPLALDDELRRLPNVSLSPHVAGHTSDTWARQGDAMVDEVARFLRHEPLQYEITADMIETMA